MSDIKSRAFLLYANWKMNKDPKSALSYIRHIRPLLTPKDQKRVVFFAPALVLPALSKALSDTQFGCGAQNCHFEDQGAFTGENSPLLLKHIGVTHCLVGHSERRQLFFEDEAFIQKKARALLKHHIKPVICVGETAEDRKKGKSFTVIEKQLSGILTLPLDTLFIAYEPVWAIGSDKPATARQIADMQTHIQKLCTQVEKSLHFLYGGSVNEKNIKALSQIPGVNGFLVGGASLEAQKFFTLFQQI